VSLIVSIASYRISTATFERSGHRVSTWHKIELKLSTSPTTLQADVVIRNSGLASVAIKGLSFHGRSGWPRRLPASAALAGRHADVVVGPSLPTVLPGNDSVRFRISPKTVSVTHKDRIESRPASEYFWALHKGSLYVDLTDGQRIVQWST
jgi:hypothetical protein